jgi:hypothetical protein
MAAIDLTQPQTRKVTGDERPPRMTLDQRLRARGFRIVSRRVGEVPIWEDKHGRLWSQDKIVESG